MRRRQPPAPPPEERRPSALDQVRASVEASQRCMAEGCASGCAPDSVKAMVCRMGLTDQDHQRLKRRCASGCVWSPQCNEIERLRCREWKPAGVP